MATPAYLRIAARLRSRIASGEFAPGDRLPSLEAIRTAENVSQIVARQAYGVLVGEGIVEGRFGSGYFVRVRPPERRLSADRYRRGLGSQFAAEMRAAGRAPTWECDSEPTAATEAIAVRLRIDAGEAVMRSKYLFLADDAPIQLAESFEPLRITGGTAAEYPEEGPHAGAGVIDRMDAIGVRVTHVTEEVTERAPTPAETAALSVPPGVHVFVIERTMYAEDLPVETADIVVPGDRYRLVYRVPVL